ncbi:multiple sugar transport system substrate-binding protein [Paenibacillus turicensis]|uniref:Multiple sugar transport system substrate-binding protein n=1 Tax=Paenibacillus turicensis TaxID=160487 RepID=A0ABS4FXQ4_9BACL|nr:extracellular solute-binding protein [Paenibacillus turicensis]MBP1907123.1 multiple sugar transport system substrate-binding protein [Paenibacillus turicensis]
MRKLKPLILLLLIISLMMGGFAGCTSLSTSDTTKLKVMTYDKEDRYFNNQYGDMFHAKNDSIKIKLVRHDSKGLEGNESNYLEKLKQSFEQEELDVLYLSMNEYNQLSQDGFLLELDPLVVRDHYNIDTIFPSITSLLREQGGGRLYGFAPTFQRKAIYYNIDLFEQYGVELPHDGMTWQEIIDLIGQFPTDGDEQSRIYGGLNSFGLSKENPLLGLGLSIGLFKGLKAVNVNTMKVTMDTEGWKQAFQQAKVALSSNSFLIGRFNEDEDFDKQQPFVQGRQAILISDEPIYAYSALDYIKSGKSDNKPFKIGMVVGPVNETNREVTRDLYMNNDYVYAIRAKSSNVEAAWELLKVMQGDEVASKLARRPDNGIPSRMGHKSDFNGIDLDVFYHLTSVLSNGYADDPNNVIPDKFNDKYWECMEREWTQVEKSQKTIDEALKTIQQDLQVALDNVMLDKKVTGENSEGKSNNNIRKDMIINWEDFKTIPFK